MGKALIIKGADFSENAVEHISPGGDVLVVKKSQRYVLYLLNSGVSAIRQTPAESTAGSVYEILVADVRDYVGRTIRISTAHNILANSNYCCFASDLGDLTINGIPNLSFSGTNATILHNITAVSTFDVSETSDVRREITKTIPEGAKYLVVSGSFQGNLTEDTFYAELV